jgi:hypothetical protein
MCPVREFKTLVTPPSSGASRASNRLELGSVVRRVLPTVDLPLPGAPSARTEIVVALF